MVLAVGVEFLLATHLSEPVRAEDPGFTASTGSFVHLRVAPAGTLPTGAGSCCLAPGDLLPKAAI